MSNTATAPPADVWGVIPAGGAGTRLWPVSRADQPKFLLPLLGDRSLLQQTYDRLLPLIPPERMLIVTSDRHASQITSQLPAVPATSLVIEPEPRGTGPAIGLAAAIIAQTNPGAVMASFAADHAIADPAAFETAVHTAIVAAEDDWLTTIGLTPTRPETGYGYIERSEEIVATLGSSAAYRALGFTEKPGRPRAEAFLATDRYLWNASMFIWKVSAFLAELQRQQPVLHAGLLEIAAAWDSPERAATLAAIWPTLPEVTIDQGLMEGARRVAVVPASMGWSDVGDWHGLGELLPQDNDGNSLHGRCLNLDSHNSVVWSASDRLIALIGVEDLVIVDTPEAMLVVDRSRAQEVRHIAQRLGSQAEASQSTGSDPSQQS